MRVTIHQQSGPEAEPRGRRDGTLENVYGLKIELDERTRGQEERIEIALGGAFFRIEPCDDQLEISIVGVPLPKILVHPLSPNTVRVASVPQPTDD